MIKTLLETEKWGYMKWHEKLKVLRINNEFTQVELAEKCIITHKSYWSWEKGVHYPRKPFRIHLAKAFGVKEEDIFHPDDKTIN